MIEREEVGLLGACYLLQMLAEKHPQFEHLPVGWNTVGRVADELNLPRQAAARIFSKWQDRGWLDERSMDLYRCQLTQAAHIAAQEMLMYRTFKQV